MTALFSSSQHNKVVPHNIVEFKAGKLQMDGKVVTADKRKGKLKFNFNADNLLNLTWTDRTSNKVEDDFMILPDEVEFVKIPQCKTGRVFLLKWKDHPRRLFFWMQEPDASKDESLFKRITDLVSNPKPSLATSNSQSNRDRLISTNFLENLTNLHGNNQEIYDLFRSMSPQNLSQFLQGDDNISPRNTSLSTSTAGSTTLSSAINNRATTSGSGSTAMDPFRHVLKEALRLAHSDRQRRQTVASSNDVNPQNETSNQDTIENTRKNQKQPDFSRALSWKNLQVFFTEHPEAFDSLRNLLPEGQPKTNEEIIESFQCPQLAHAKAIIGYIICTGQFVPIAKQFKISNEQIDKSLSFGNLIEFCKELEEFLKNNSNQQEIEDSNMDDLD